MKKLDGSHMEITNVMFVDKFDEKHINLGETSRSLYERTKEHMEQARKRAQDSHMVKHWD